MRKQIVIVGIMITLGLFLSIGSVSATAPRSIDLSYDYPAQELYMFCYHPSDEPEGHFIEIVIIRLNGIVIEYLEYSRQTSQLGLEDTYDIQASPGDVINVTCICVLRWWTSSDTLSAEITVEGPTTVTSTSTTTSSQIAWTDFDIPSTVPRPSEKNAISAPLIDMSIFPFILAPILGLMVLQLIIEKRREF